MKVRLHPQARAELREARGWYFDRSPLSATAFAHAVAVSQIAEAPTRYPMAEHGTRKFVLQRFPFNIFYRPSEVILLRSHTRSGVQGIGLIARDGLS